MYFPPNTLFDYPSFPLSSSFSFIFSYLSFVLPLPSHIISAIYSFSLTPTYYRFLSSPSLTASLPLFIFTYVHLCFPLSHSSCTASSFFLIFYLLLPIIFFCRLFISGSHPLYLNFTYLFTALFLILILSSFPFFFFFLTYLFLPSLFLQRLSLLTFTSLFLVLLLSPLLFPSSFFCFFPLHVPFSFPHFPLNIIFYAPSSLIASLLLPVFLLASSLAFPSISSTFSYILFFCQFPQYFTLDLIFTYLSTPLPFQPLPLSAF